MYCYILWTTQEQRKQEVCRVSFQASWREYSNIWPGAYRHWDTKRHGRTCKKGARYRRRQRGKSLWQSRNKLSISNSWGKRMIIVPSDCQSRLRQSLDQNSLPDEQSIAYYGGCLYIFLINCFYHLTCLCNNFYGLSALVGCWSLVFIRRIIYKFLNVCPFDYTGFAVSGKVGIP